MPKAKITVNADIDPASAYFEMYQSGATIIDICRKYGKSRNTVLKYLRQNPDFVQPGYGDRRTGKDRPATNVRKEDVTVVSFNCPQVLLDLLDKAPGKNRSDKINTAIENYLKAPVAKRFKTKYKTQESDKNPKAYIASKLVSKLDRSKRDRTSKIIAAIEQYLTEKNVI
ncbi:MAG: hypothetical protein ACRC2S_16355 [Waterburya sp.]